MKKLVSVVVLFLFVAALAVASGQSGSIAPAKTFNMKLNVIGNAEQIATKAMTLFKDEIEKSTGKQITVEVHHSASLFQANQVIPAIIRGNLEIGISSPASLAEYAPYMSMFTAGYLFKDYDQMVSILGGDVGRQFYERVAKDTGVRPLTTLYLGARQINLRSPDGVRTPADLAGVKLRMPGTEAYMFLGESLGANPTPLPFGEVYMALKTGTVDGQDNPLPATRTNKFYEVTKSISLTNHYISMTNPLISEKLWQELGPELQAKVAEAMEKARVYNDAAILKAEAELVDFFVAEGLNVVEPDREAFAEHVQAAYMANKKMIASWDMDLYRQITGTE